MAHSILPKRYDPVTGFVLKCIHQNIELYKVMAITQMTSKYRRAFEGSKTFWIGGVGNYYKGSSH